ncbi:hypothetical protein SDC9_148571 [bioreactor metagenome]|uniref:Uncharacterized protein n=1 Tax=bioreactor metagenome TaxID=1076179 RepID=A0A645EJB0_9ZZZZ
MVHAKAMFFIDNEQAQRFVFHIFCQQRMGTDNHVNLSFCEGFLDRLPLFRGLEARKARDLHREIGKTRTHRVVMLLG